MNNPPCPAHSSARPTNSLARSPVEHAILRAICSVAAFAIPGLLLLAVGGCTSKDGPVAAGTGGTALVSSTGGLGGMGAGGSAAGTGGTSFGSGGSNPGIIIGNSGNAGSSSLENCVTSCKPLGGQWCGVIGDACGGKLTCPECPTDWSCAGGLCVGGDSCQRLTCEAGDSQYCGTLGDGCGGTLTCGECSNGGVCGGGGLPNVCTIPNCTPKTCVDVASNGHYCGDIGDGCGGVVHCGDCADGKACGGDGVANVCPGAPRCTNLQCTVANDACPADSPTTLTGTVYDPAGKLPLYNALVYIPNDPLPLPPIADGVVCEQCAARAVGTPVASALSDVNGKFTLSGVPSGANVPLVLQVGKWRREVTLNTTLNKCTANAVTDVNLTRLPRKKSEGHIPRIALTTGSRDALECLLRRIGIADEEFTLDSGQGRVHMYVGGPSGTTTTVTNQQGARQFAPELGGATFPHATTLWSSPDKLKNYDILMLSCEGGEFATEKESSRNNLLGFMNQGGRVFLDHWHFYWLRSGPAELQGTATYEGGNLPDLPQPSTAKVDMSFPKGAALADWLMATQASTTRGELTIYEGQHTVSAVTPPTQRWIYVDPSGTRALPSIQYMTFNTPVTLPPENQCGRVVFTDIHIAAQVPNPGGTGTLGGDTSTPTVPFPQGCSSNASSAQAKALEFMFFDLSSCVTPGEMLPPIPAPPGVPPPPVAAPPPPPPPPPPPR